MHKYKLHNGSSCKIKTCDCDCNIGDRSVTLVKLAEETIDFILENKGTGGGSTGGNVGIQPCAPMKLFVQWTNERTDSITDELNIESEIGDTFTWQGYYVWESAEGYSNPYKIESNVFETLTEDGKVSDTKTITVTDDNTFNVTLHSYSGQSTSESSSIKFLYPVYYGKKGDRLTKELIKDMGHTVNKVNLGKDEYFVYKYHSAIPKLESIVMNDVIQAFNYSEEVITSDTANQITLRVYTSANPGAFTNTKLTFK